MIKCEKCGNENEDDSSFCDQCGAAVKGLPIRESGTPSEDDGDACPECGGAVEETSKGEGICTKCGAALVEEDDDAEDVVAAPPPPEPAGDPVTVYTTSSGLGAFAEAALVKSQLEAAGFFCEMLNSQHTTMVFGGGVSIGIRLVVPASQAEAAREFLKDARRTRTLGE